jgi:hypothetical protein
MGFADVLLAGCRWGRTGDSTWRARICNRRLLGASNRPLPATIVGTNGDDMWGGSGDDVLYGGPGDD